MVVEKRPAAEASRPGWPKKSLSGKGLRMSSPAVPPTAPPPALTAPPAVEPPRPTIAELFAVFAAISLSGFGGVLAWARRMMVERRRWFTAEQFNEAFALCAFLPGGNMVNFRGDFRHANARAAGRDRRLGWPARPADDSDHNGPARSTRITATSRRCAACWPASPLRPPD